jgi:plastocyanin domain-containing protein
MAVIINLGGICLIIFTIFWFWIYNPTATAKKAIDGIIDVIVDDGIYTPEHIQTKVNHPLTLRFERKTASTCAKTVVFPDFQISKELPLNEAVELRFTPDKVGDFEFTCQMGMYKGILSVMDE